ncbi:hypothetical protein K3722_15650 [Leisingera caerulea]|uniref:Late embryogenesis abundant protein n=1 Tax=Leisingera caerulea TaxID=506591 RepID=A0ABY5WUZ5_LEICA|nr:hypothetical protein [Leisingera caerulea]UWQ57910.1 hypothetical protein K3722_15650 [Leisingera caerulea]
MSGTDKVKTAAKNVAEEAKSAAASAAETAKQEAQSRAEAAKESVADEVKSVAAALRTASDEMRSGSPHERAIGQVAGTLADVSDSIRNQDLGDMVHSVSGFARKNPVMFLSSAALLGFAAARFAKASDSSRQDGPAATAAHAPAATPSASPDRPASPYPVTQNTVTKNTGEVK